MPVAVVTGANSGIGHAFAQLLINEGFEVHAVDQVIGEKLQTLQCRLHRLDVRSPESIALFAQQLVHKPLDVLLHVAGIMPPAEQDALGSVTKDHLTSTFETNAFGPLLLTQALLPNLLLPAADGPAGPGRVGIVSSRVGSIGDNSTGGAYAYRASKAAANSIGRSLAVDLRARGVAVALLHPGVVRTNLNPNPNPNPGGADGEGGAPEAVEPEEAATKLWAVFAAHGIEDTGRFWHREGQELPW